MQVQTYEQGMMGRGYSKRGSHLATHDPAISLSRLTYHVGIQVEIIPGTINHTPLMPNQGRDLSYTLAQSSSMNALHITAVNFNEVSR